MQRAEAYTSDAGDAPAEITAADTVEIDVDRGEHTPATRRGDRRLGLVVRLAVLVHLAIAVVLVVHGAWQAAGMPLMVILAVPFAQTSLIALTAGVRAMRSFVRFGIAAGAALWGWFIALTVLPGIALRSPESAAWAAGLMLQAGVIVIAASAWQAIRAPRGELASPRRIRMQYDLASLLAWTGIVAVLLGLGRSASGVMGWGEEVARWTNFRFLPNVGGFNAAIALCVALALAGRRSIVPRLLAAALVVALLGWFESTVLAGLAGRSGGLARRPVLVLAATQAALIAATLLPRRLCRK